MRLKRIELAGFKSFVDPVKIELSDGITAIVGPNGSGKSNIVDAIRWVLGEHSAKQLRGGVMDDLIFQGSETRPPVGICDVELTFAVEIGRLPSPYHELDEISIRRRLMREGGSDAFINGKMVRLKDVVDLFLDTGISTHAYAIIEQGAITRMISAKAEERRLILEEAAGVMKYRFRRREAERKMKDTRQNLDRVMDLLEEVRTQCRSLKRQASRAERFKKMQDERQQMQALSMGIRYRQGRMHWQEEEQRLNQAKSGEEQAASQHAQVEHSLAEFRKKLVEHEGQAQKVQDDLRRAEQKRSELQQQAERLAGNRRLLAERKQMLERRLNEAEQRQQRLRNDLADIDAHASGQDDHALRQAIEQAQSREESARQDHDTQRSLRDKLLAEFERIRSHHEGTGQRRARAEATLDRLEERETLLLGRQQEINHQLQQAGTGLKQVQLEIQAAEQGERQAETTLGSAQKKLDSIREQHNAAEAELAFRSGEVRRLKGEIQELQGRTASRDIPHGMKDELRSAGVIWVDEALRVPAGLELAAAAALRGESADAKLPENPGLSDLAEQIRPARDLPVAFHTGSDSTMVKGSLAEALKLDAGHPLCPMFARTLLVDDIADAPGALAAEPGAAAAVSRDGWRLESSGWFVPPAHKAGARRLTIQRELQERQRTLNQAEEELEACKQGFEAAEATLAECQQVWQQAHLSATEAQSKAQAKSAEGQRFEAEVEALQARSERLQSEIDELRQERKHWSEQLSSVEATPDPVRLAAAQAALDTQNTAEAEARQHLDQMKNIRAAAQQDLALHQQATENLDREKQRLELELKRVTEQKRQDEASLSGIEADMQKSEQRSEMDQMLREASASVEHMHQKLNQIRQLGHELQQAVHEEDRNEHRLRASRQEAAEQRQQREVSLAAETAHLQDLKEEIRQRCHRTVEELMTQMDTLDEELDEQDILARASELEERLTRFGPVNLLAIEEYDQAAEREQFLSTQAEDLEASLATLADTITRIDRTTRQRFRDTFEQTNAYFKQTFPRLFGGGRAELRLDSDDLLTAGVEVIAQPPGKRLQDLELLSGGEKALTAVALVFSIFRIKPAPFCVLDEVDAPLDDSNIGRFGELVQEFSNGVQFLHITHNKVSMQMANRIIGVSMPEAGV